MLPKEAVKEFIKLYEKKFKVELSDEEASFRANNLINLYRAVVGKSVANKIEDVNNHNKK